MSSLTATDMFCGAGGSSQGALNAGITLRMAANHWQLAIETHRLNFPDVDHDCAEINQVRPERWPTTDILWASPECTNHSRANGRKKPKLQLSLLDDSPNNPGAVRSRATMWDVPRFAEYHDYNAIIVENVIDARKWVLFESWIHAMRALGYRYKTLYFNAQFFGVPQSRDRMFVVFWKSKMPTPDLEFNPLGWCTDCDQEVATVQSFKKWRWGSYGSQYLYRCPVCATSVYPYYTPAAVAIDWSNLGTRIGDRTRPLKPSTIRRIEYGLKKYGQVLQLCTTHTGAKSDSYVRTVGDPLYTQTTRQETALTIPPSAVIVFRNNMSARSAVDPLSTISASAVNHGLVVSYYGTNNVHTTNDPIPTITAIDRHALVINYYGKNNTHTTDQPLHTLTTTNRHALVDPAINVNDCSFRMFQPSEIGKGMAFNPNYKILGTKRQQVRQYGNAVPPPFAEFLYSRVAAIFN